LGFCFQFEKGVFVFSDLGDEACVRLCVCGIRVPKRSEIYNVVVQDESVVFSLAELGEAEASLR
jgi:hypothetical protein